jgi:hypothetical protein
MIEVLYIHVYMYIAATLKSVYDVSVADAAIPICVPDYTSIFAQEIILDIPVATCIASVSIPGMLYLIPACHVSDVATCHGDGTHMGTCARILGLVYGAVSKMSILR